MDLTRFPEIELTDKQEENLDSVRWLVKEDWQSGRSYLLAVVYIEKAFAYPNTKIYIKDHYNSKKSDHNLRSMIINILQGISVNSDDLPEETLLEFFEYGKDWIILKE